MMNFPNNPLRVYKNFGDLYVSQNILQYLNSYLIGNDSTILYLSLWSINHFLSGFVLYLLLSFINVYSILSPTNSQEKYWIGFILHTLWEIFQIVIENTELTTLRGQVDVIIDTIVFMGGMVTARYIPEMFKYTKTDS